jgi:hypothetical protein
LAVDKIPTVSRRPNTFIIGAPKCGTSSLYDYLGGHPDIYMSPVKEPFYFCPDVPGPPNRMRFGEDETEYLGLFRDAGPARCIGEASTAYLRSHQAPRLIRELAPEARLIVMLRNPVDLVHALHGERVSHGAEDVLEFGEAIALDDERRQGRSLPPSAEARGTTYGEAASFGPQLARWLEAFPREQLHIIILEEFARDTLGSFREVLEFLGVAPDYRPSSFGVSNRSHSMRGGMVRSATRSAPVRWLRTAALPRLIGPNRAARAARTFRHSRLARRPNPRPPMPKQLRRDLERRFAADVEAVSAVVGRDMRQVWFGGQEAA